ncbi:MAG TPA: SDR family oxidoreductase [Vicinamibacterales bacterium]|nr:SDR family oxidoreductase [Vicinamibacterales bacterium]
MFRLDNKTALVTGAGSGIGEAIAHTLARAGAHVYVADRDTTNGARVAEAIQGEGGACEFVELDVTDEAAIARLASRIESQHTALDILVNNAGIGHVGTVVTTGGVDMDRLYAVNVRGVFNTSKAFIGGMLARKSGVIINMASIGGVLGIRDRLAYVTTKTAVVGLTKAMAMDHAADGIRVNCVCPGRVETPFVKARLKEYPDPDAAYREMAGTQAIGRMGKPEEIAAAVLYLASDEAAFITGTPLLIDGGWSMGK